MKPINDLTDRSNISWNAKAIAPYIFVKQPFDGQNVVV